MSPQRLAWLKSRSFWCGIGLGVSLLAVVVTWSIGATWGLPSAERNKLYFQKGIEPGDVPPVSAGGAWAEYPNTATGAERVGHYPRSAFNPLRSYHPDEYVVLKSLRDMYSRIDRFPGFYAWPPLYFYEVGGALVIGGVTGLVPLKPDMGFYYKHPDQMARMYLVGRLVTLLFALIAVVAMWGVAGRLYGSVAAVVCAFFLAVCPAFTYHAGFMTTDVPMFAMVLLVTYFAVRAMQEGELRWYLLAGVCVALAATTRYYGALSALAVIAAHVFSQTDQRRHFWRRVFDRRLWLSGAVAIVLFLLIDPYVLRPDLLSSFTSWGGLASLFHPPFFLNGDFVHELAAEARGAAWTEVGRGEALELFARSGLGSPLTIMSFVGLCFILIRNLFVERYREDLFLLLAFVPVALFLLAGRPPMVRYLFPALPLVILAAGLVGTELIIAWPTRRNNFLLTIGILAVAVVALLAWGNSTARALLKFMPDTRTMAGEWIAKNVPRASTIGVIEDPWQFQMPPIDMEEYRVVATGQDPTELRTRLPEWFVYSDFQVPPLAIRGPMTPAEERFWGMVKQSSLYTHDGPNRLPVERWANLFGLRFSHAEEPHDMRYVNPHIYIYRKVTKRRKPGLAPAPPSAPTAPAAPASDADKANHELSGTEVPPYFLIHNS